MTEKFDKPNIEVIYDSECPICTYYACSINKTDSISTIDGRQPSKLLENAASLNLDIDHGTIAYSDGKYFYGYEALVLIANNIDAKGLFGFLYKHLFRHRAIAKALYPIFVFIRLTLLRILGKPLINQFNEQPYDQIDSKYDKYTKLNGYDNPINVYYNSACPVCDMGIKHQKKIMQNCNVNWTDIHIDTANLKELHSDIEFVRKRLHVIDGSGKLHIGIDAFIAIWNVSPNEKWKARLFSAPVIHGLSSLIYNIFAWALYKRNRLLKRW